MKNVIHHFAILVGSLFGLIFAPLSGAVHYFRHHRLVMEDWHNWLRLRSADHDEDLSRWEPLAPIAYADMVSRTAQDHRNSIGHVFWRARTRSLTEAPSGTVVLVSRRRLS